jgi:Xaa-Pro aminopeptidase
VNGYLKKHTEALVKDVGIEVACRVSGKSKATLGRYYSEAPEHAERYMPVDTVAALEAVASHPHVTAALSEIRAIKQNDELANPDGLCAIMIGLSEQYAALMAEFGRSVETNMSENDTRRMLREAMALQKKILALKVYLEGCAD